MRERRRLDEAIGATEKITNGAGRTIELIEHGRNRGRRSLGERCDSFARGARRAGGTGQGSALLAGEADANDTYIEIHAGAGGTESQDWAEMLQRMYTRWAERHGFKVEMVDYHVRRTGGHQVSHATDQGRERLWLCQDRKRRAPPGPHQPL